MGKGAPGRDGGHPPPGDRRLGRDGSAPAGVCEHSGPGRPSGCEVCSEPARRFLLRAELDAAFFHLYGLARSDTDYILDTFTIVRQSDEKAHGEYRTKRVILEIYDAMAEAARTGQPYVTRLDPPPADPRVAHPPDPARERTKESAT